MERVIDVKAGSDIALHIARIIENYGKDARFHYENVPYRIVKIWKSDQPLHIKIRLKQM